MSPNDNIKTVPHNSELYWQAIELRDELLRKPLGLKFTDEELAGENSEIHIVYLEGQKVKACLVLKPLDGKRIKMRQVAVHRDLQGKGIGKALVRFSEDYAREKGYAVMECHARDVAIGFYERLGYHKEGKGFVEVTIPHFKMVKRL